MYMALKVNDPMAPYGLETVLETRGQNSLVHLGSCVRKHMQCLFYSKQS